MKHSVDNHASTSSLYFYRPDALPDAQPTVKALKASCKKRTRWITGEPLFTLKLAVKVMQMFVWNWPDLKLLGKRKSFKRKGLAVTDSHSTLRPGEHAGNE